MTALRQTWQITLRYLRVSPASPRSSSSRSCNR